MVHARIPSFWPTTHFGNAIQRFFFQFGAYGKAGLSKHCFIVGQIRPDIDAIYERLIERDLLCIVSEVHTNALKLYYAYSC